MALALWAVGVLGLTALSPFRLPHYGLPAYSGDRAAGRARLASSTAAVRWLALHLVAFAAAGRRPARPRGRAAAAFADQVHRRSPTWRRARRRRRVTPPVPALGGVPACLLGSPALIVRGAARLSLAPSWRSRVLAGAGALARSSGLTMVPLLPGVGARARPWSRRTAPCATWPSSVARQAAPEDVVAHEGPIENSGALEWYSGRRPVIVDGRRSVLGFGATRPEAPRRVLGAATAAEAWRAAGACGW